MTDKKNGINTPVDQNYALIMKGGGIKGIAYVGALQVLNKYFQFDWYVGTSAGAISAILLGAGYRDDELEKLLSEKDFSDFQDAGVIGKVLNFIRFKGLYKADTFVDWIDELLSTKLNSKTEVKLKHLPSRVTVYATRTGKEALIFDSTDPSTREKSASYAARCSMSIPFIFTPQYSEGMRVFDGGAQNNFPIESLRRNYKVDNFLGLYLGPKLYKRKRSKSIIGELISIWTESIDNVALEKYSDKIIIIDPSPISTLKFKLSKSEKDFLLDNGKLGALEYLAENNIGDIDPITIVKLSEDIEDRRKSLVKQNEKERRINSLKAALMVTAIVLITVWIFSFIKLPSNEFDVLYKNIDLLISEKTLLASSLEQVLLTDNPLLVDLDFQTNYVKQKLNRIDSLSNVVWNSAVDLKGDNPDRIQELNLIIRATDGKNVYQFFNRSKVLDERFREDANELVARLKEDVRKMNDIGN